MQPRTHLIGNPEHEKADKIIHLGNSADLESETERIDNVGHDESRIGRSKGLHPIPKYLTEST